MIVHTNRSQSVLKLLLAVSLIGLTTVSCFSSSSQEEAEVSEPVEASEPEAAEPSLPQPEAPSAVEAQSSVPAEQPAAVQPPPTQVAPTQPTMPAGSVSHRVMYVKVDGTKVYEKPDMKSKVVGKLEKGDHRLVDIEGEWAKTQDGRYISMKSLSDKGVGRRKKAGAWTNPDGTKSAPVAPAKEKKSVPAKVAPSSAPVEQQPAAAPATVPSESGEPNPDAAAGE